MTQPKDFGFGPDEAMLRDSARRFLKENAGIERLRATVAKDHREAYETATPPAPWDESLWTKMVELGWAALAEEVGRAALPSPLISTVLATYVLRSAASPAASEWLEKIATGTPATLAVTDARGSWEPADTGVRARRERGGIVLSGSASFVQDARKAQLFVVSARSDAGLGLYAVTADAPGVTIAPDHIVDLTRDQATITFDDVEVAANAEV